MFAATYLGGKIFFSHISDLFFTENGGVNFRQRSGTIWNNTKGPTNADRLPQFQLLCPQENLKLLKLLIN
jgi:hypothetical protein